MDASGGEKKQTGAGQQKRALSEALSILAAHVGAQEEGFRRSSVIAEEMRQKLSTETALLSEKLHESQVRAVRAEDRVAQLETALQALEQRCVQDARAHVEALQKLKNSFDANELRLNESAEEGARARQEAAALARTLEQYQDYSQKLLAQLQEQNTSREGALSRVRALEQKVRGLLGERDVAIRKAAELEGRIPLMEKGLLAQAAAEKRIAVNAAIADGKLELEDIQARMLQSDRQRIESQEQAERERLERLRSEENLQSRLERSERERADLLGQIEATRIQMERIEARHQKELQQRAIAQEKLSIALAQSREEVSKAQFQQKLVGTSQGAGAPLGFRKEGNV